MVMHCRMPAGLSDYVHTAAYAVVFPNSHTPTKKSTKKKLRQKKPATDYYSPEELDEALKVDIEEIGTDLEETEI
ncbi:hypothetical protein OAG36_00790 [bacterium]|nr:hypothetical protein [bacterium]